MTGKNSMTYKCRMCPNTAFKWQSCLYKHLLISHFSEKIKSIMPKIPTKDSKWLCPMENCDYEAKLKHILNFRQEPVVYVNGKPFTARDPAK